LNNNIDVELLARQYTGVVC